MSSELSDTEILPKILDLDLYNLLDRVDKYLKEKEKRLALFVDGLHLMTDAQLLELCNVLVYINRNMLPIIMFGSSDLSFRGRVGDLYSDSEMMFEFISLPNNGGFAC